MWTQETIEELFKELSPAEKIVLAQDLWDDVVKHHAEGASLSEAQKAELSKRREEYRGKEAAGETWDEVRSQLKHRLR